MQDESRYPTFRSSGTPSAAVQQLAANELVAHPLDACLDNLRLSIGASVFRGVKILPLVQWNQHDWMDAAIG